MLNIDKQPFAFFITLRTYNTWVHGDIRGSVDRKNNVFNTKKIPGMPALASHMDHTANESPLLLNKLQRKTILDSIVDTCRYNNWCLFTAHVRTNHVHIVIRADQFSEKIMGKIKCYATKSLKNTHPELSNRKNFWARHGSTVNIWAPEKLFPSLYYVVKEQGNPMALYYDKKYYDPQDELLYEAYFLE